MKESLRLNLSLDLSLVKTLVKLISVDDNIEFNLVQFNSIQKAVIAPIALKATNKFSPSI